ncbi:hypothetical protein HII31_01099 [Pseudocercospora fuligena]|uniref:Uncharacterized protein n=1 Tax=Pseudocercospora fuligena TaxID=685502 RepID=A0A8H6RSF8_9PEZI|nr:hypothetical protein HII31_01099 [Pseudocercospora fuligena]
MWSFGKGCRSVIATTAWKKQKTAINILSLPNELLDIVAKEVEDKSDLLNLRLTNRRLGTAATHSLQLRTTAIHLEACHSSIERFEQICQCPALAAGIKCIIYVVPQYEKSTSYMRGSDLLLETHDDLGIQACEDALERYAKHQAEAENTVRTGRHKCALLLGIKSFPKLAEIIWAIQPSYESSTERRFPESFNRDQRWHRGVHWPGDQDEALAAFPIDGLWNRMLWYMQESASYDCDNLIAVLNCYAGLHPDRLLQVGCIECPYVSFGNQLATIARTQPAQVSFVLSRIEKLSLTFGLAGKEDWTAINTPTHAADKAWSDFFQKARNLQHLQVDGFDWVDRCKMLKALLSGGDIVYSNLKHLSLAAHPCHTFPQGWPEMKALRQHSHTTQQLISFVRQHKDTLKHLDLYAMSGVDERTRESSADCMRTLLEVIKTECLSLEEVRVEEVSMYEEDWTFGVYQPHSLDWERQYEQGTILAQLAREAGGKVVEEEVFYKPGGNPHSVEDLDEDGIVLSSTHLHFTYTFGWKILRPELGSCECQDCNEGASKPCAKPVWTDAIEREEWFDATEKIASRVANLHLKG